MNSPEPLSRANLPELIRDTVTAARTGDHRARQVTIGPRTGIVTPHLDQDGNLDASDLAAQVWALAHDEPSDSGRYTGGIFVSRGIGHYVQAPQDNA